MKFTDILASKNLVPNLTEEEVRKIGLDVKQTYETDKHSRQRWEKNNKDAMELALQVVTQKTYPWEDSSNVKFPLLTIAALQFSSRSYPALVKAPDTVKYRVQGKDEGGVKAARASRISRHMSYQLLEEDEGWETDHDRLLMALPITGCVFKKSYYDPVLGHNCSRLVLPMDLVVHYYAKSIEECERKTEVFQVFTRQIKERVLRGVYTDHDLPNPSVEVGESDKRQGITPPGDDPHRPRMLLEQHAYLDLDKDGYPEPYVITTDRDTNKVFRIVHRIKDWTSTQSLQIDELKTQLLGLAESLPKPNGQQSDQDLGGIQRAQATAEGLIAQIKSLQAEPPDILSIKAVEHYTKYSFIPSPDGGFYDLGWGCLLSPLNNSVNTLINQLIDSGTLQNGSVGFIGKGARIKGGKVRFSPNEWKRVDVAGSTLRDALVPLPVNAPSAVLFQLLGLLIQYSERLASVTDTVVGENPGQNTPAYNMSAMLEQGLQVFNGIFKRVYKSFRSEIRKLYALNSIYLNEVSYIEYQDESVQIARSDYRGDAKDLIPAADPNAFSNKEKQAKAGMIAQRAMSVPGYDMIKVEQLILESMDTPNSAELYPLIPNQETGELEWKFPPPPNPEFEIQRMEEQRRTIDAQAKHDLATKELMGKLAVMEVDMLVKMAQAEKLADAPDLERMKIIYQDVADQRKTLLEMAKLEKEDSAEKES